MDCYYMKKAINEAKIAYQKNEVPVGAVVVDFKKNIVVSSYNKKNITKIATKHAEIIAIEKMCKKIGDWRLENCVLYVTLEPCLMCAGAIIESRIKKVIIGCSRDIECNVVGFLEKHNVEIVVGVEKEECSNLLKAFFKEKR